MTIKLKDGTTYENAQCMHGGNVLSCRISNLNIYEAAKKFTEKNCSKLTIIRSPDNQEVIEGYTLSKISVDGNDITGVSINLKGVIG